MCRRYLQKVYDLHVFLDVGAAISLPDEVFVVAVAAGAHRGMLAVHAVAAVEPPRLLLLIRSPYRLPAGVCKISKERNASYVSLRCVVFILNSLNRSSQLNFTCSIDFIYGEFDNLPTSSFIKLRLYYCC